VPSFAKEKRTKLKGRVQLSAPILSEIVPDANTVGWSFCTGGAGAELGLLLRERLAKHDVDGAGDRLGAELGRRAADDLDPLDHVGRDAVEREAGRHALAVHQDLRVSGPEAPASGSRRRGRRDRYPP
jgi:hypothetical protein